MQKLPVQKTPLQKLIKLSAIASISASLGYLVLSTTATVTTFQNVGLRVDWAIAQSQSWWDIIFGRLPKRGGSGSPFCVLWPKPEFRTLDTTFSKNPLFIWKNSKSVTGGQSLTAQEVRVFQIDNNQERHLIWQTAVAPNQQQIRYGEGNPAQKNLESGGVYEFQVSYLDLSSTTKSPTADESSKLPVISPIRFTVVAAPAKTKADFSKDQDYFKYLIDAKPPYYGDVYQAAFDPPNSFSNQIRENPACATHPTP